jgi:hypothetical protein
MTGTTAYRADFPEIGVVVTDIRTPLTLRMGGPDHDTAQKGLRAREASSIGRADRVLGPILVKSISEFARPTRPKPTPRTQSTDREGSI